MHVIAIDWFPTSCHTRFRIEYLIFRHAVDAYVKGKCVDLWMWCLYECLPYLSTMMFVYMNIWFTHIYMFYILCYHVYEREVKWTPKLRPISFVRNIFFFALFFYLLFYLIQKFKNNYILYFYLSCYLIPALQLTTTFVLSGIPRSVDYWVVVIIAAHNSLPFTLVGPSYLIIQPTRKKEPRRWKKWIFSKKEAKFLL